MGHPLEKRLFAIAMNYPGAHADLPWGHHAIKVRKKTFLFMSKDEDYCSLSVKLPESGNFALSLEACEQKTKSKNWLIYLVHLALWN